jgi:hypothetical protein
MPSNADGNINSLSFGTEEAAGICCFDSGGPSVGSLEAMDATATKGAIFMDPAANAAKQGALFKNTASTDKGGTLFKDAAANEEKGGALFKDTAAATKRVFSKDGLAYMPRGPLFKDAD